MPRLTYRLLYDRSSRPDFSKETKHKTFANAGPSGGSESNLPRSTKFLPCEGIAERTPEESGRISCIGSEK